jgi:hypothetical protein
VRPCICDNCRVGPYDDSQCLKCWLFHNSPTYRSAWEKRRPPNFIEKAVGYARAVRDHFLLGLPVVDDATYRSRLESCDRCPLLSPEGNCNLCGCPVQDKAMWGEQACPSCRKCGRPKAEHPAEGCDGFEPKWAAVAVATAPARKSPPCCGS